VLARLVTGRRVVIATSTIGVVIIAISLIWPGFLPSYRNIPCTNEQEAAGDYCGTHHIIFIALWLGIGVLDRYGNVVSAISTVAIAVFTYTLWKSTHRLYIAGEKQRRIAIESVKAAQNTARASVLSAEAAKVSADIAYAAQRPRFILMEIKSHRLPDNVKAALIEGQFEIEFRNEGGSAAEIIGENITYSVVTDLPITPRYPLSAFFEKRIGEIIKSSYPYKTFAAIYLKQDELDDIINNRKTLFIYGYLQYRDFLDNIWNKGFIAGLSTGMGRGDFIIKGTLPLYTYTKLFRPSQPREGGNAD